MKISILILSHNRPILFKRCIISVLEQLPNYQIEILVNNDSYDIDEICTDKVQYFYKQDNNLGEIYKFLFDKAKGEFIYFLEDDDYILPNFFKNINFNYELNYLNYRSYNIKKTIENRKFFQIEDINKNFQLGQLFFKKETVGKFPTGNALDNDWVLFQEIKKNTNNIIKINNFMFQQTVDGKDNISFIKWNKDKRWSLLNKKE